MKKKKKTVLGQKKRGGGEGLKPNWGKNEEIDLKRGKKGGTWGVVVGRGECGVKVQESENGNGKSPIAAEADQLAASAWPPLPCPKTRFARFLFLLLLLPKHTLSSLSLSYPP